MSKQNVYYVVTHAQKEKGADPGLTPAGIMKAQSLKIPQEISGVVIGTGRRFKETLDNLTTLNLSGLRVKSSPFCGSADSGELKKDGTMEVVLSYGDRIPLTDYDGMTTAHGADVRAWVFNHPGFTLFVGGREFMSALGMDIKDTVSGALYCVSEDGIGRLDPV